MDESIYIYYRKKGLILTNLMIIDALKPEDWEPVKDIYLEGISTGNATFQKEAPTWEAWDQSHLAACRIVARNSDGKVWGWAALTPISGRCVYEGVAEVSVYVKQAMKGQGIGSTILQNIIQLSEEKGIWTLQSGIFPENHGSLKIHLKNGFREVGRRERIGKMDGVWRDVVLLERRSSRVGIN
jgi:phosphinothricin acetyltransferase